MPVPTKPIPSSPSPRKQETGAVKIKIELGSTHKEYARGTNNERKEELEQTDVFHLISRLSYG
jgi:hypothetical protein